VVSARSYRPDCRKDAEPWYSISVILVLVRKFLLILLSHYNFICIELQSGVVFFFPTQISFPFSVRS